MKKQQRRVLPRADGAGYLLNGKSVDGFADRTDLDVEDRVAVARLARRFTPDKVTPAQRDLLERVIPPAPSARLRGLAANRDDVASAADESLYSVLKRSEIDLLNHPERKVKATYPLSVGELAKLTDATPRQIRHWTERGLLPEHRLDDGDRRYYSAATARAMLLASWDKLVIRALASITQAHMQTVGERRETARLLMVFGDSLKTLADALPRELPTKAHAAKSLVHAGLDLQESAKDLLAIQ